MMIGRCFTTSCYGSLTRKTATVLWCFIQATGANAQVGPIASGVSSGGIIGACGASSGQLLYDNAGNCGGLAAVNNGVVGTDGSGNATISATLPTALTIPNATLSTPVLSLANLSSPTLTTPVLTTANLSNATLTSPVLSLANMSNATLTTPVLSSATLSGTTQVTGQIVPAFGTPTIASGACGGLANGVVLAGSTNQSGQVIIGSSVSATCVITFSTTLSHVPNCVISPANVNAATKVAANYVSTITTTNVILAGTLASTNQIFLCF